MSRKAHSILNAILAFLYMPLSLIGFLMGMATEGAVGETNVLIIAAYYSIAWVGMLTPITAYGGLFLSNRLFNNGRIKASLFTRFLPLIFIAAVMILASMIELFARYFS